MNKKDRIAVVVSLVYLLIPILLLIDGEPEPAVFSLIPVLVYWGYRFIKSDISFLGGGS